MRFPQGSADVADKSTLSRYLLHTLYQCMDSLLEAVQYCLSPIDERRSMDRDKIRPASVGQEQGFIHIDTLIMRQISVEFVLTSMRPAF